MNVLVDSDIVIEYLNGNRGVVHRFWSLDLVFYCSDRTVSEVVASRSLGKVEKLATRLLLRRILRVIDHRDPSVMDVYDHLIVKYGPQELRRDDAIVAATAIAKKMPLWTNNRRHFERIGELELFDPD